MPNYIFSVVNNLEQYNQCVGHNIHLQGWTLHYAHNTPQNNRSIAAHYNQFIQEVVLPQQKDGWVIFCHQDFEFLANPISLLQQLDTQALYGPLGMQRKPCLAGITRGTAYGQLRSGPYLIGKRTAKPVRVDTLDCCCIIVHSSLLKKQPIRFDNRFDFHLYAEDFCLQAQKLQIPVYALQMACIHYSNGTLGPAFFNKYELLIKKFPDSPFVTMCVHLRFGKKAFIPSRRTLWLYQWLVKIILPLKTRFFLIRAD